MWILWILVAATEVPYDRVDQDGDGADLIDVDGDGWPSELAFGKDCNDRDARVHPEAVDTSGDGVDTDCGGSDGQDGPGPPATSSGWMTLRHSAVRAWISCTVWIVSA